MRAFWKKTFLDKSIVIKMNLYYIALIVVPLLLLGVLFSGIMSNIMLDRIEDRSESSIMLSLQGMEMNLSELDSIMVSNLWDSSLTEVMRSTDGSNAAHNAFITEKLRSMANSRKDISYLMLMRRDGKRFSFVSGAAAYPSDRDISMIDPAVYASDRLLHGKTEWINCPGSEGSVLGIRKVFDFENLEDLGYLFIVLKESTVQKQYASQKTTPGSFFVLQDSYGNIVSHNGGGEYELDLLERKNISNDLIAMGGQRYYRTARISESSGWLVNLFTPEWEAMESIYRTEMVLFAVILMLIAVLLIFTTYFARHLIQPISEMQVLMKEVRHENFDIHANEDREDELGSLAKSFNAMASRIKHLIKEDYQNKLLIQETEYKYLRAQINPHFLYNTLDSISWLAAMNGSKDVSRMAVALGRILRWSISNKRSLVMLCEDMEIIRDYLVIQRMRYGESLEYEINIGPEEREMLIPKMILQPLVENALVHGLESKDGAKLLRIEAVHHGNVLQICIEDNGLGISEDKLTEIYGNLQGDASEQQSIGLYNVDRRIKMLYGSEYGLRVKSKLNEGTQITVELPIDMVKEDGYDPGNDR